MRGAWELCRLLDEFRGKQLENYILPGLSSTLLDQGRLRLFEASRDTEEHITPHNHRFNFACLVLQGDVDNTIYSHSTAGGDWYMPANLVTHSVGPGDYTVERTGEPARFTKVTQSYSEGDVYAMKSDEIHSIKFSRDAVVLFFEGTTFRDGVSILEPYAGGKVVPTFRTEPWMFQERPR